MTVIKSSSLDLQSLSPKPHYYLDKIESYVPGKAKISGNTKSIIKLSSNENALGSSPKALEAYHQHVDQIFRYADGSCLKLREKLADKFKITANQIVCGAGSDELIALITCAYAGVDDEIIYSQYGFLMYPISAQRVGAKPIKVAEKNLRCDVKAIVEAITKNTKIIFIANPNNPTGSYLTATEIQFLLETVPKNILLVLDHAYEEFVTVKDYPQALEIVNNHDNVIILHTFSKIYGLASLRLGWSYSCKNIADILHKIRGPFNVSGPAQDCAIASLDDHQFVLDSINHNQKWLELYQNEIAKLKKLKAYPSIANFILLDFFSVENCQKAQELFLQNSIILREMNPYFLNTCLRLTIGKDHENQQVIELLKNFENSI
jgi:histidinol-phosphate aminotransferase